MEIYNLIIEDRHCDVEVRSFRNREKAIEICKKMAKLLNTQREDMEENIVKGCEFFITYSCEGDYAYVQKTILEE